MIYHEWNFTLLAHESAAPQARHTPAGIACWYYRAVCEDIVRGKKFQPRGCRKFFEWALESRLWLM
jgi:hypothetical protein